MKSIALISEELWRATRSGARAGRGFRFQDAVATHLLVQGWAGLADWNVVTPEGIEDVAMHGGTSQVLAQVKSRHDPRGTFSVLEIAQLLFRTASRAGLQSTARIALILERPVAGLAATGWDSFLADSKEARDLLGPALARLLPPSQPDAAAALLSRTHVIVEPDPLERALRCVEQKLQQSAAVARLIVHHVLREIGECTDLNVASTSVSASRVSTSRIDVHATNVLALVDPNAIDEAVRQGLCEVVDFDSPVVTPGFYSGVSVLPGHVSAGLVFERPEQTVAILEALEQRGKVLIAGPSGAGKSALAWLAAYATRHSVRWYRVKRLGLRDVAALARHARTLEPRPERPVGFVVDDAGQEHVAGWDDFVRDIATTAGVLAIGTVREEDLFTLATSGELPIVRPSVDERLAERVFDAMRLEGRTSFPHWREPLEQSKGLMLEYTHLLTQGERLGQTIAGQVSRRLRERRDDELALLRTISFAASHGAAVDAQRLRLRLGMTEPAFARPLRRLIAEHAVRQEADGTLGGLHEIRSQYTAAAFRELMPSPEDTLVDEAIAVLRTGDLSTFIVQLLRAAPTLKAALFKALAQRIRGEEAPAWISIMHGLAMSTLDIAAAKWVEIFRQTGADDRFASFAFNFALADTRLDVPQLEKINRATERFTQESVPDMRREFREAGLRDLAPPHFDSRRAHEMAGCMLGLRVSDPPIGVSMTLDAKRMQAEELNPLLDMLRTLTEVDPGAARSLVQALGGTDFLLERLFQETPWMLPLARKVEDGKRVVAADLRFVSDEVNPTVDKQVVRLCELLLGADPDAEIASSNATLANGAGIAVGEYRPGSKRLERKFLPTAARVAWTRSALRAVQKIVGAQNQSHRVDAIAKMVTELAPRVSEAAEYYCRDEKPKEKWQLHTSLHAHLTSLVPPPSVREAALRPLEHGEYAVTDPLQDFANGLPDLARSIAVKPVEKPLLTAVEMAELATSAERLQDPETWRWTGHSPVSAIGELRNVLLDLRQVFGYAAAAPERVRSLRARLGRSSRRNSALARAAAEAREYAESLAAASCRRLEAAAAERGLVARVLIRPAPKDDGFRWPSVEYCVAIVVNELVDYLVAVPLLQQVAGAAQVDAQITFVPEMRERIAPIAFLRMGELFLLNPTFAADWRHFVDRPILEGGKADVFTAAVDTLAAMSAIISDRGRDLNQPENTCLERLENRLAEHLRTLANREELAASPDLVGPVQFLVHLCRRFETDAANGTRCASPLAAEFAESMLSAGAELGQQIIVHRLTLMQQDLLAQ